MKRIKTSGYQISRFCKSLFRSLFGSKVERSTDQFLRKIELGNLRRATLFGLLGEWMTGRLVLKKLATLDKLNLQTLVSIPETSGEFFLSHPLNGPERRVRLESPTLRLFRGENILFEPNQDYYFQGRILASQTLPEQVAGINQNHSLSSEVLRWNHRAFCLIQSRPAKERIPTGILLCGKFPENWYHWMVNILPSVGLLDRTVSISPEIPLLVPETVRNSNFEEALRLVTDTNREIIYLPNRPHEVVQAYILESPVHEVKVIKGTTDPDWSVLGFFHFEEMLRYRERFLSKNKVRDVPPRRKIFLLRGEQRGRPYNEPELREILESRGFYSVELDKMPVEMQVGLFRDAQIIVGMTGAQWVGAMWATNAICLYLVPQFLSGTSTFPKLGSLGGSRFFEFHIEHDASSWSRYYKSRKPAIVCLESFERFLDQLEALYA